VGNKIATFNDGVGGGNIDINQSITTLTYDGSVDSLSYTDETGVQSNLSLKRTTGTITNGITLDTKNWFFDGSGDGVPIPGYTLYPNVDLLTIPFSTNWASGGQGFNLALNPSSNYGPTTLGTFDVVRYVSKNAAPGTADGFVSLYNDDTGVGPPVSQTTITFDQIIAGPGGLADTVYQFTLDTPITVTAATQMLALEVNRGVRVASITGNTGFTTNIALPQGPPPGDPTGPQVNRNTGIQFGVSGPPSTGSINATLPSAASVGAGCTLLFVENQGNSGGGVELLPFGAETINGTSSHIVNGDHSIHTAMSTGSGWIIN